MLQHLSSIRTTFRTPLVLAEFRIDVLSLIDVNIATSLCFRPPVQLVPASTHASLMPSVLVLRLCGIYRRIVCIAENVL